MIRLISILLIIQALSLQSSAGGAEDFVRRAKEKYRNKDYAGAAVEYSRAINLDSTSPALYNNRGLCRYKLQYYQEALADYNTALRLDSTFCDAHYNKGNCLMAVIRYPEAMHCYDRVIQLDPQYNKAYSKRAQVLYLLEDYTSAIDDYSKAIRMGATADKELYLGRGNSYLMIKKYNKAKADYDTALSLDPEFYKAYVNRGICKLEMGDADAAIRDFTLCIRYNGMEGEGYYYRAMANVYKMKHLSDQFDGDPSVIAEFKVYNELACSDLMKSKAFGYAKAFEASLEYCGN